VELVHYDDASDPERVAELYRRLIREDRVELLVGPYGSGLTLRATAVAEAEDFPILAGAASADAIWARGYRNVFGIDVPSSNYMDPAVQAAVRRGAQTAALFYGPGAFAEDVARGVRREAGRLGLSLVMDRQYAADGSDLGLLAAELAALGQGVDAVFGASYLHDAIALTTALRDSASLPVGMIALTVGPALPEFQEELGDAADGIVGVVQWLRSARVPRAQDFAYRYRQRYGQNPGVHAAIGYSAGQVLEAAVRLAGTTEHEALRAQLRSLRFRSLIGHYRVDESGRQIGKGNYLLQWQDGRRRLVAPATIAERELIYPLP
jgi:branched-chain amino acid transport system substrate-binding protein